MTKGRKRLDPDAKLPRDKMHPEARGLRRVWVTEAQRDELQQAAREDGCHSASEYIMRAHRVYQEQRHLAQP